MNNDLISRDALKKALKSNCDLCNDKNTNWCEHCCPLNDFEDLIDNAPSVDTYSEEDMCDTTSNGFDIGYDFAKAKYERPQGEWILNKDENPECPFCRHSFTYWGNFCGNCGADMRKGGATNDT